MRESGAIATLSCEELSERIYKVWKSWNKFESTHPEYFRMASEGRLGVLLAMAYDVEFGMDGWYHRHFGTEAFGETALVEGYYFVVNLVGVLDLLVEYHPSFLLDESQFVDIVQMILQDKEAMGKLWRWNCFASRGVIPEELVRFTNEISYKERRKYMEGING